VWVVRALLIFVVGAAIVACTTDAQPPPIGDSDGGPDYDSDVTLAPCAKPNPGCGCADAGTGAKVFCGNVYRISGTHLDCSPGYITCGTNEVWGDCIGDSIFDGN
jgi:hypothetical protein